jgi:hypothetical protein
MSAPETFETVSPSTFTVTGPASYRTYFNNGVVSFVAPTGETNVIRGGVVSRIMLSLNRADQLPAASLNLT